MERPSLERRVLASLEAGRLPVLLGGCGMGRTSLLLRLEETLGLDRAQYLDIAAAATTPERCFDAVRAVSRLHDPGAPPTGDGSTRAAFLALLDLFDAPSAPAPATLLLDEFVDVRTFESFPGLRHVQAETIARLAQSPTRFVLASRFTARVHRLLRDAPARFEVIHMPPLDPAEVQAMGRLLEGGASDWAAEVAPMVTALTGGHAAATRLLLGTMAARGHMTDAVAALAESLAPHAPLAARLRECYELRLHRARGYGALKGILGILAETEPLTLTEIAQRLRRTPGSTKDYLSWLEDVDLVVMRGKRYSYPEPLLRLYVRLYARPVPPGDDDLVREVGAFARTVVPSLRLAPPGDEARDERTDAARSGIIEID